MCSWWPSGIWTENGWTDRWARKQSLWLCEGMSQAGEGMAEACSDGIRDRLAGWGSKAVSACSRPRWESPHPLAGADVARASPWCLGLCSANQPEIWVFGILCNNCYGWLTCLTGPQVAEDSSQAALPALSRGTETPPRRPWEGLQALAVTSWAGRIESGPSRLATPPSIDPPPPNTR